MKIIKCDETYKGKELIFNYSTNYYYDCILQDFSISFVRKPFPNEVKKQFSDTLLSDWLEEPELYAMIEKKTPIAFLEISKESWHNTLRISNIWVSEDYRHLGIGSQLMEVAHQRAKQQQVRAIVLETQSCNDKAIRFYLKHGFHLIGCDTISYSNKDIEKHEVRIEMGKVVG